MEADNEANNSISFVQKHKEGRWSVVVPLADLGGDDNFLKRLLLPMMTAALTVRPNGQKLCWQDRGWCCEGDFYKEIKECFEKKKEFAAARNQTSDEASDLQRVLCRQGVRCEKREVCCPASWAGVDSPPLRCETVGSEAALLELLGPSGGAKESSVVVTLPDGFNYTHEHLIDTAICSPDPSGGHPDRYSLEERGWENSAILNSHLRNEDDADGGRRRVVARRQTAREAEVVARRLTEMGMAAVVHGPPDAKRNPFPLSELVAVRFTSPELELNRALGLTGSGITNFDRMMRMLDLMNAPLTAPATKKEVRDKLPRVAVDQKLLANSDENSCSLCLGDLCLGEVISRLPCGHHFHVGGEAQANMLVDSLALTELRDEDILQATLRGDDLPQWPAGVYELCEAQILLDTVPVKEDGYVLMNVPSDSPSIELPQYFRVDVIRAYYDHSRSCHVGICLPPRDDKKPFAILMSSALTKKVNTDEDCPGILAWLENNNMCPLCRFQLEKEAEEDTTETGEDEQVHMFVRCSTCGVEPVRGSRYKYKTSNGQQGDLCSECQKDDSQLLLLKVYSPSQANRDLSLQVDEFFGGHMHDNAECDECKCNPIVGDRYMCTRREEFDLCGECEAKKKQPYPMVKIKECADVSVNIVENTDGPDLDMASGWNCPNCDAANQGDYRRGPYARCNCGVVRVVYSAIRDPKLLIPIFEKVEGLYKECTEMRELIGNEGLVAGRMKLVGDLRKKIDAFVNSDALNRLEQSNWNIRGHLSLLLTSVLDNEPGAPIPTVDVNSRAIIRSLHDRLKKLDLKSSFDLSGLSVPKRDNITLHMTGARNYELTRELNEFLIENSDTIGAIVNLVSKGGSENQWVHILDVVLPQLERRRIQITAAVNKLRRGGRDLNVLTADVRDFNSCAVIETILLSVVEASSAEICGAKIIDDEVKQLLSCLYAEVDNAVFNCICLTLIRILRLILTYPTEIQYQSLKREQNTRIELLFTLPHAVGILKLLGFQELDDSTFIAPNLCMDELTSALQAIELWEM